jgi:glycerol-3-phosphate dehydrogenase
MSDESYDVAIVGAGINGAGIARDAALRGLSVVVLDQNDMCSGTTAASSRLIHGGLRYLEYAEIPLVFESLRERITLRNIAPHLIRPLRISIPIYKGAKRGPWLIRLGMIAYDLLSVGKTVARHDMLGPSDMLETEPGLASDGLLGAARYFDAQITFAERLVLENLLAAKAAGAHVLLHTAVSSINIENERVSSIDCEDTISGRQRRINARVVINAAGPWVDAVVEAAVNDAPQLVGGTKGSHIVVGKFDGAPGDAFYVKPRQTAVLFL